MYFFFATMICIDYLVPVLPKLILFILLIMKNYFIHKKNTNLSYIIDCDEIKI